jgi:hypothetical protein
MLEARQINRSASKDTRQKAARMPRTDKKLAMKSLKTPGPTITDVSYAGSVAM